jgi:HPt (histidine-containing phosphotransfer) domain-containing protein
MIRLFEANTPKYIDALKEALRERDYSAMKQAAHKLKPTGAYIGVDALKPAMAEIELLAEHQTDPSMIAERIGELDILCEEIYSDIRQWKTTIDQRTNTP